MTTNKKEETYFTNHCPDCTHCFDSHYVNGVGCKEQSIKPSKSPKGVRQFTLCGCKNDPFALREWELRLRRKAEKEMGLEEVTTPVVSTLTERRDTTYYETSRRFSP